MARPTRGSRYLKYQRYIVRTPGILRRAELENRQSSAGHEDAMQLTAGLNGIDDVPDAERDGRDV